MARPFFGYGDVKVCIRDNVTTGRTRELVMSAERVVKNGDTLEILRADGDVKWSAQIPVVGGKPCLIRGKWYGPYDRIQIRILDAPAASAD